MRIVAIAMTGMMFGFMVGATALNIFRTADINMRLMKIEIMLKER